MPFTENQKRDIIAELQGYLYTISYHNEKIPHIVIDGIYGPETAQAVKIFQHFYNLPPTGETDDRTWEKIVSVYKSYLNPRPLDVFSHELVLTKNSSKEVIYILQVILNSLFRKYVNVPEMKIDGVYSPQMENSIGRFMGRSGADNITPFGAEMWNTLAGEYNANQYRK